MRKEGEMIGRRKRAIVNYAENLSDFEDEPVQRRAKKQQAQRVLDDSSDFEEELESGSEHEDELAEISEVKSEPEEIEPEPVEESEETPVESRDQSMPIPEAHPEVAIEDAPPTKKKREKKEKKKKLDTLANHPELATVWSELEAMPPTVATMAEQPKEVTIKMLPFQLEGLDWLLKQEESRFNGGILADEMGMGKTIQIIALIVTKRRSPNLILCPTVALMQWYAELEQKTAPGTLKVMVYHGAEKTKSRAELESYDVVLSTYAIIENSFRKQQYGFKRKGDLVKEPSLLHKINWGRVVLDEAHAIKDRSSSTARAVFNLKADKRWSVSGTPLQNRVGELYSLIRFMDADPFSYYFCKGCPCKQQTWKFSDNRHCDACGHISHHHFCWWNAEILKPIQKWGAVEDGLIAFQKLGALLDRIMLRRTKNERASDLGLPPRVITVRRDLFSQAEEEFYESLYTDASRQFATYVAMNEVLNNYANIFTLLSRMRLAANHPGTFFGI